MWQNDSTYRGNSKSDKFYFKSPIAKLVDDEDEYSRRWIYMSDDLKEEFQKFVKGLNDKHDLPLPKEDDLTSYDNPDYLWLMYELENIRRAYNNAMLDPCSGRVIEGRKLIPYVQLRLKAEAFSRTTMFPKSSVNCYGQALKPHYVVEFEQPFLRAFMNFIFQVFDDNPQTYVEVNGKKIVTHQFKAPIYRIAPFADYFETRHDIPAIIFQKAVQMLLAHELAHIGNGHLDLQAANPEYGKNKDVLIVEEDDADAQAICWVLGIRFLEVPGNVLDIEYSEFQQELSLTIFSVYTLFTWIYSKEERVWNEDTLKEYGHKDHLPYQLRAYNMLSVASNRMRNLGRWCERDHFKTSDDILLTPEFFDESFKEALLMIDAFERTYHMFFAKTEDVYNLALEQKFDELHQMVMDENIDESQDIQKENIPWLLGWEEDAQNELKRVHDLWQGVREQLIKNGTYCNLRVFEERIPLPEN